MIETQNVTARRQNTVNKPSLEEPSAGIKASHTNTSFAIIPYISDTESEISLRCCTQDLKQDFLSLSKRLA